MADKKNRTYTVRLWTPLGKTITASVKGSEYLAANFAVWELANTEAREAVKLVMTEQSFVFLRQLQRLRDRYYAAYGKGLDVSSFYRTQTFNKTCGGSPNSAHLDARAADLVGIPQSRYEQVMRWWSDITASAGKVGGINYYPDNRLHVTDFEQKFGNSAFKIRDYRKGGGNQGE